MSIEHKKSDKLNTGISRSDLTPRKLPLGILSVLVAFLSLLIGIAATLISSWILQAGQESLVTSIGFTSWFFTIILFLLFYLRNEGESSSDEGLDDEK